MNSFPEELYNNLPCGYHSLDKNGRFVRINDTELQMLGYSREEVLGRKFSDLISPESLPTFQKNFSIFKHRGWINDLEIQMRCKNGMILPVALSTRMVKDEAGNYLMSNSIVVDISERKQTEAILNQQQVAREHLLAEMTQAIHQTFDVELILQTAVDRVRKLLQTDRVLIFSFHPDWSGKVVTESVTSGWNAILESEFTDPCFEERYVEPYRQGRVSAIPDLPASDVELCYKELMAQLQVRAHLVVPILQREDLWGLLIIHHCCAPRQWLPKEIKLLQQLTAQLGIAIQQAELLQSLQHDALHDSLTNLPNRALLMEQLKEAFKRQRRHPDRLFGVLFLDLDRFKVINDSLGHLVGDQLLMALADRLKQCKRDSDAVSRLGGDEFVILLEELSSSESAIKVAERIHQALEKPFILQNKELFLSVSIGIALSIPPHYYLEPTQLLRDADTAMYHAKKLGKSCHAVFKPSMHTHAQKQFHLENDLRRAISRQELAVYYQPIFSLETNCLERVEALVRWQHPERGLIPLEDFIPMAEETGIIIALDQWVLKNACCQLRCWQEQFPVFSHLILSVNLSGHHFSQMNFIEQIDRILTSTGILGQYLKLEITESVLLSNPESTVKMLKQLRKRNIQICLDDFGTGYSSLSYLHRFPLNVLKIDRSFVSNLKAQDSRMAIIRTIVTLGHELGIEVIAEGIESAHQMQFLKALGCHYGQGYYFSPPVDSQALTNLLTLGRCDQS